MRLVMPSISMLAGVLGFCVAVTAPAQSALVNASRTQKTVGALPTNETFEKIYQQLLDGIRNRDVRQYDKLLTPDYIFVAKDGSMIRRGVAARKLMDMESADRWTLFKVDSCELSIRATVAVGPCWYQAAGHSDGVDGHWRGVVAATFILDSANQWRIASTRPSVLQDKK